MKTENTDPQMKNSIGAFTAASSLEEISVPGGEVQKEEDGISVDSSTLDSRLEKLAPVVTVAPSVTIDSVLPDHLKEYAAKGAVEKSAESLETIIEGVQLGKNMQKEELPDRHGSGAYYTISGGPETLVDENSRNATSILEKKAYSTIGIPTKIEKKIDPIVEESSLFVFFCKITVLVLICFVSGAYSAPFVLPFLVDKGYLTLVSEGVYSTGGTIFTNTISSQIPYLTSLLVVGSFVVLFISYLVDLMVGKSIFLFAKVFIFIIFLLLLGVLVFYLQINGTDIIGAVNGYLEVFK